MPHKSPNYLKFIIIALAIILLLLFSWALYGFLTIPDAKTFPDESAQTASDEEMIYSGLVSVPKTTPSITPQAYADSPALGPANAKLTIFEYSSFDCSFSQEMQAVMDDILKQYPEQVRLVWKDAPSSVGSNVYNAHVAARCAQLQGKFWPYANLLFSDEKNFTADDLKKTAKQAKLDLNKFNSCLDNQTTADIVDKDIREADQLAVDATPVFYIGKQQFQGYIDTEDLKQLIEEELN